MCNFNKIENDKGNVKKKRYCKVCKKDITKLRKERIYCSRKCSDRGKNSHRFLKFKHFNTNLKCKKILRCSICYLPLNEKRLINNKRTCCDECDDKLKYNISRKERTRLKILDIRKKHKCIHCNEVLQYSRILRKLKTCSNKCSSDYANSHKVKKIIRPLMDYETYVNYVKELNPIIKCMYCHSSVIEYNSILKGKKVCNKKSCIRTRAIENKITIIRKRYKEDESYIYLTKKCKLTTCKNNVSRRKYLRGNIYCSEECKHKDFRSRLEKHFNRNKKIFEKKECLNCKTTLDKTFHIFNSNAKFCSKECRISYHEKNRYREFFSKRYNLNCSECNTYVSRARLYDRKRTCCDECEIKRKERLRQEAIVKERKKINRYKVKCKSCGCDVFYHAKKRYRKDRYCSKCIANRNIESFIQCELFKSHTPANMYLLGLMYTSGRIQEEGIYFYHTSTDVIQRLGLLLNIKVLHTYFYPNSILQEIMYKFGFRNEIQLHEFPNINKKNWIYFIEGLMYGGTKRYDVDKLYITMPSKDICLKVSKYLKCEYEVDNGEWCIVKPHQLETSNNEYDMLINKLTDMGHFN